MSGPAFTGEQQAAIDRREGPLLLAAAAGSGKTSVLVERFVRSVLDDGLAPASILAITFTDKAAGELRSRIRAAFVRAGRRDLAQEAEGAWILTIHGFCARVLRAHAIRAGLDPRFTVLDEPTARQLRAAAFDEALTAFLNGGTPRPEALDVVAAHGPDRLSKTVMEAHDALRSAGHVPALPVVPAPPYPAAERDALAAACDAALAEIGDASGLRVDEARGGLERCRELVAGLPAGAAPPPELLALKVSTGAGALKGAAVAAWQAAHAAFTARCADWEAAPVVALVDELLRRFADAYAGAKRTRAALDFDDLELATRDLFAAAPDLATAYAGASSASWSTSSRTPTGCSCSSSTRSTATTCSSSATSCSRSTASATPT